MTSDKRVKACKAIKAERLLRLKKIHNKSKPQIVFLALLPSSLESPICLVSI